MRISALRWLVQAEPALEALEPAQVERVRQQELVKEREAYAIRDNGLDHGL